MTPTPEQAKAELERRATNKALRRKGEQPVTAPHSEVTAARKDQLQAWAKDLTPEQNERR